MAHQNLIILRHTLKQCLANLTNNHIAAGKKFRFDYEFIKGDKAIGSDEKRNIRAYYKLTVFYVNTTNETKDFVRTDDGEIYINDEGKSIPILTGGIRVDLFRYCVPISASVKKDKSEELAIKEFLSYSVNTCLMVQNQLHDMAIEDKNHNDIDVSNYKEAPLVL